MKETDLFDPIRKLLKDAGCRVYTEVPIFAAACDIVALSPGGDIWAVEMKLTLSRVVRHQAIRHKPWVHRTYVAVPTRPSAASLADCEKYGIGIIVVSEGEAEFHTAAPRNDDPIRFPLELDKLEEGTTAGMPCRTGVSASWVVQKSVEDYVRAHPNASRQEIYRAVPSHYSSPSSLFGCLKQWHGFSLSEFKKELRVSAPVEPKQSSIV